LRIKCGGPLTQSRGAAVAAAGKGKEFVTVEGGRKAAGSEKQTGYEKKNHAQSASILCSGELNMRNKKSQIKMLPERFLMR
jgi:hypothetical protein